jgi:hypothetical protein
MMFTNYLFSGLFMQIAATPLAMLIMWKLQTVNPNYVVIANY